MVDQRAIIMKFWVSNHGAMAVDKLPILESILMLHSLESGLTQILIKTESNLDNFFYFMKLGKVENRASFAGKPIRFVFFKLAFISFEKYLKVVF